MEIRVSIPSVKMKKYRFMKQNTIIAVLKITGKPGMINTCKLLESYRK